MAEQDGEGEERLLFVVFSQERKDKEILQEDHEIKVHIDIKFLMINVCTKNNMLWYCMVA